ncbi:MAG: enoyl-CoA hydratase/isomerase family protein [Planctomycetales bacterium]|nr:enoyl-CoA hydratase/isomerase family protein [Planctomycetales bacterium]
MEHVNYSLDAHGVATITLNRDEKRNALTHAMSEALLQFVDRAAADGGRVVVLRANRGVNVWCAGHDLSELDPRTLYTANPTLDVFRKVQSSPLPVIAMVEGRVFAAGLLLVLCADIVLATPDAEIAISSNRMGIPLTPDLYAFWLRVMGLHRVKELLFTAAPLSAQDALQAGLYNHVVQPHELEQRTAQMIDQILANSPEGIANTKFQLNLIAQQTGLTADVLTQIAAQSEKLLHTPDVQRRIADLLQSLRGDAST